MSDFSELKGLTISAIEGAHQGSDAIRILTTDGDLFMLNHEQDCCESVNVSDVCGDLSDLIGSPILIAEESTIQGEQEYGTQTSTFYKLATVRGYVTITWVGESNGYYSESVDLTRTKLEVEQWNNFVNQWKSIGREQHARAAKNYSEFCRFWYDLARVAANKMTQGYYLGTQTNE